MGTGGEGARQVLITTSQTGLNDLCIGVQDTGPGLSPEALSRLFEPFYTTKPNGTGLVLAIYRSIIEAHGGRLWATGCEVASHTGLSFSLPSLLDRRDWRISASGTKRTFGEHPSMSAFGGIADMVISEPDVCF